MRGAAGRPLRLAPRPTEDRMINSWRAGMAAIMAAAALLPVSASAQNTEQRLGTVHFATSCNEVAQRRFDCAMRYQPSFWYSQAREIFECALKADPRWGIALWGIALTLLA